MTRLSSFITISFLLVLCYAEEFKSIPYKDCKSNFEIISVEATHCPGDQKFCPFKRGTSPRIRIAFKPNRNVESMKTMVTAKVGPAVVPFQVENDNACQAGNITCPLEAGKTYFYSQTVSVLESYPKINVQVNWLVTDKDNASPDNRSKRDICLIFLAKVVD